MDNWTSDVGNYYNHELETESKERIKMRTAPGFQILLALTFISCTSGGNGSPGRKIITKFKVFDEVVSPNHRNCESEIKLFEDMESDDCSFKLDNEEFDIIEKFRLDDKGNLQEYWTYKSEGPLIYSREDLEKDQGLSESINGDKLNVQLLGTTKIIDTGDTLTIERISHNMIFVVRNQELIKKHVRYLYQLNKN